ncbi:NB-ARC domain-containing protein [Flavobacterium sp. WC2430]|uniref:NB-ARC domain-containing protein n=1 Tax=Flavobacterium sp. WC2430 TaxID=3234137 RepID=UPI00346586A4
MNNYIKSKIDQKTNILKSLDRNEELKIHLQAKLEFYFILMLGYLWNKNISIIDEDKKEIVFNSILQPSIGALVSIIRHLDIENEIFKNKNLKSVVQSINSYPSSRNDLIGHGYSFEDNTIKHIEILEKYIEDIENNENHSLFSDIDFVKVFKKDKNIYTGINYKANGNDYMIWNCPSEIMDFEIDSLYIKTTSNEYFRITPFIEIEDENNFYTFCSIDEKLTGRVKFNQLLKTNRKTIEFEELATFTILDDILKRKTSNGTIINLIDKNFKKYIDIGISNQIIDFLLKNKSSVFATLWGHGGIGKTAAVQNVCDILSNQDSKKFDYIVFTSAKDRYYNFYKGIIQEIPTNINSLDEILKFTNNIIFNNPINSVDEIINYQGKMLLIIDDFETFVSEEKFKIIDFIKKLNINNHKVIITTRSATLITGEEIECNELESNKTIEFLIEAYKNEFPNRNIANEIKLFKKYENKIHEITSGRPLFILQFAILLAQKSSIEETLEIDIKSSESATKFLYDRILEYLSVEAKNMFLAINLLVDSNDLTGTIQNLKFILGKEDFEENFDKTLNELIKLKIIELIDKEIFKVYSHEILNLMRHYYDNKSKDFDPAITNRFTHISSGKKMDTDLALLKVADSSRFTLTESSVENQYRRIIKRETAKEEIRVKAILNYAEYLANHKNDILKALKQFEDYKHWFSNNSEFILMNSRYLWVENSFNNRNNAVKILDNFLSTRPKITEESYLQILGTQLQYATYNLVTERDSLKDKKRFNEIDEKEFRRINQDQRDRFNKLYNYPGLRLFDIVKNKDLMSYSSKCRAFILDGLSNFVEICIRSNKHEIAYEVCKKITTELPIDFHKPFISKMVKLDAILNKTEETIIYPETELSIKLKKALKIK